MKSSAQQRWVCRGSLIEHSNEVEAATRVHLAEQRRDLVFDRVHGGVAATCNLGVGLAFYDGQSDRALALGHFRKSRPGGARRASHVQLDASYAVDVGLRIRASIIATVGD